MHTLVKCCLLGAVFFTAKAMASDPFLEFDSEKYGVLVTRERNVKDYEGVNVLKGEDPSKLRVLVTTGSLVPDANTYAVAEALFDGLKQTYTMAEFRVFGRGAKDNESLANEIRANFDYVFIVGNNHSHDDYEQDETIYGSRASSVRCSTSVINDGVDCRETQSQSVPIGTQKGQGTIFNDIFFVNYGTGRQVSASWDTNFTNPGLAVSSPIGHMDVSMIYGLSAASFCENTAGAQAALARMAGANIVSSRPDRVSFKADPDDIGCGN